MTLTIEQFALIENILSLAVTAMGASSLFFILSQSQVQPRFRPGLLVAGIVSLIGCYHYFHISTLWNNAFELAGSSYIASGQPFVGTYRYVGWMLTTPLLLVEFVIVLKLSHHTASRLLRSFVIAAVVLILAGYLGKLVAGNGHVIFSISLYLVVAVAFATILFLLWTKLPQEVMAANASIYELFSKARIFITTTWLLYPIIDITSSFSIASGPNGLVLITACYSLLEIVAICGLGFFVYQLAMAQSHES